MQPELTNLLTLERQSPLANGDCSVNLTLLDLTSMIIICLFNELRYLFSSSRESCSNQDACLYTFFKGLALQLKTLNFVSPFKRLFAKGIRLRLETIWYRITTTTTTIKEKDEIRYPLNKYVFPKYKHLLLLIIVLKGLITTHRNFEGCSLFVVIFFF